MCSRMRSVSLAGGVGADEHGDDLAVVVDELAEQLAHRVGRRAAWSRRCRRATSAIQSPLRIAPPSTDGVAHGLRHLAGAHALARRAASSPRSRRARRSGRTRRARRAPRARSWSATTATCFSVSASTWWATGDDVLVVRQHDHAVGRARLDRLEDLRGRRVHRLAAGDHVLHAEAREQAADAVADADRDDRGRDRPQFGRSAGEVGDDVGLAHPALLFDLLDQVGDADRVRAARVDAGFDRGADVVGVHVAVPDAVAADDDDRVADRAPTPRGTPAIVVVGRVEEVHHLVAQARHVVARRGARRPPPAWRRARARGSAGRRRPRGARRATA